jgi:putative tricarboxylic transport membrane protein
LTAATPEPGAAAPDPGTKDPDAPATEESQEAASWETMLCAVLVLALGLVLLIGSLDLNGGLGYQAVGPAVFPQLVGFGTLTCGALLVVGEIRRLLSAVRAPRSGATGSVGDTRWRHVAIMVLILAAYAVALEPVGFWQASGVLFTVVARLLGSRRWVRDAVVGFALSFTVYLFFDRVLEVQLPDGFIHFAG